MRATKVALLAAATIIGALSACASDSDGGSTAASSPTAATTASTSAPVETDPAPTAPAETDPPPTAPVETEPAPPAPVETDPAPVETEPAPSTVAEPPPKRLLAGLKSGGITYIAAFMEPQVTFTIPEDHGPRSWNAIRLEQEGFVILAVQAEPTPGVPAGYEPGLGVALVTEGETVDDVVASVTAYAADNDDFDVAVETGQLRGEEVTVLRGSSRAGGFVRVPTSSDSGFGFPDGPRKFVAYVIDGPSHVVVAHFDSHELDFDFMEERATPVLDSIEFP